MVREPSSGSEAPWAILQQDRAIEDLVFTLAYSKLAVGSWARPGHFLRLSFPSRAVITLSSP